MMSFKKLVLPIFLVLALRAGAPYINIAFPNGGEVLKTGGQVRIVWQSQGVNGNVAILLFKSGKQYAVIAAALPDNNRYRLRICALADLRINDFSDRDFSIKK